jgi:hypothetical protein
MSRIGEDCLGLLSGRLSDVGEIVQRKQDPGLPNQYTPWQPGAVVTARAGAV